MLSDLKTVTLGELASFEMGQSPDSLFVTDAGHGIPFLQGSAEFGAVTPQHSFYCTKPKKICEINDVLISVRAPVGTLNKADRVYCIGRGLAAIRFKKGTLPKFGWHLLNYWASELRKVAQGSTFEAIGKAELANLPIIYLPETEQQCIAEILDTIDEAIAHTSSIIAKLKQIKAGLLHDLLTRGLDENGELRDAIAHPEQFKDSSLGRVPKDWEVRPLATIAKVNSGVTLGRNIDGLETIELPYLRVANVQDGYLDLSEVKTVRIFQSEISRFLLQPGDVLMNEGGDYDKLGRGTVWSGQISPCLHQNHVFRVRVDQKYLIPEFLALVSASNYGKKFFILSSKQSTNLASINSTQLKSFPVPCPTISEQKRIISVIETQDTRIRTEETYLEKLKLQKKGLMHDLLTGKVRVNQMTQISDRDLPASNVI
jgi:type I restriction enzyme, S subunit